MEIPDYFSFRNCARFQFVLCTADAKARLGKNSSCLVILYDFLRGLSTVCFSESSIERLYKERQSQSCEGQHCYVSRGAGSYIY